MHVIDLAIGVLAAVEIRPVPRSDALGAIGGVLGGGIGAAVDAVGPTDAVPPPPLGTGSPSSTILVLYLEVAPGL
jgi:hypothetical protein